MKGTWDGDRDPLRALQAGDRGPFEDFVAVEAGTFLAFFARLGATPEEAEDLTQETFLKLYRSAAPYDPKGTFPAYAMRIARNAWIDRRRRHAARPRLRSLSTGPDERPAPLDEVPDGGHEPGYRLAIEDELQRFRAALGELSGGHRAVFELAVLQELSYAEVAEILSIPVGTVKSRVFHAVRRLRGILGEDAEEPA